jgi:hypothetical protein
MITSRVRSLGSVTLPSVLGEHSMIPFNMKTLEGVPKAFIECVTQMLHNVSCLDVTGFLTVHGKVLKAGGTLRRGSPHTDGNYEPINMRFGGGGWKVGERGPELGSTLHARQYLNTKGGIIMASNYSSCLGWEGTFEGKPRRGGDCRHLNLNTPFLLEPDQVYYGNNHFIHESLPVDVGVHRVVVRITLPEDHKYN